MVHYRRNKIPGALYFFTVTLKDRKSKLLIEHINDLRGAMEYVQGKYPFKTKAIVVLPDHIHAIWQLPSENANYSIRWQRIKGLFTQKLINKSISIKKDKRDEYDLWQRRFWEHTIRDEKDLENHIHYIHYNPVKHHLVSRVKDWPYSSFHSYVKKKLLLIEWSDSGFDDAANKFGE